MGWVMTVGYVLEVCGLVTAAVGLRKTWADNADGMHFLEGTPRLHRAWNRVTRRRGGNAVTLTLSAPSAHAAAVMLAPHVVVGGRSAEERLTDLERDLRQALDIARDAQARVGAEARKRRSEVEALEGRVSAVEDKTRAFTRRAIVEGVPLAMIGLCLAGFGLTMQGVATWQTWA